MPAFVERLDDRNESRMLPAFSKLPDVDSPALSAGSSSSCSRDSFGLPAVLFDNDEAAVLLELLVFVALVAAVVVVVVDDDEVLGPA